MIYMCVQYYLLERLKVLIFLQIFCYVFIIQHARLLNEMMFQIYIEWLVWRSPTSLVQTNTLINKLMNLAIFGD